MSTEHELKVGTLTIPPAEQTPLVLALVEIIRQQAEEIKALREEVHKLKGTTRRPKIEPSRLLKPPQPKTDAPRKRPGSAKRAKTRNLPIHQDVPLTIEGLPAGTRVEGYRDFVVQDLKIAAHNTRYRRTVYRLPDGTLRVAPRPVEVSGHFGVELRQFILYQVHQTHVSHARLLEQLHEYGVDISSGQLNEILLTGHDALHAEKDALLPTARAVSNVLHTDDTSARHCGQNAVCTHFGNEFFASFHTTDSKSRLNFLRLLCQPEERYSINEEMRLCLEISGAPQVLQQQIAAQDEAAYLGREAFLKRLKAYRAAPSELERGRLAHEFDRLFQQRTGYPALDEALSLLHAKRTGLLAVLEHPHLPLHNNLSETDIREYARLRKVSGGTRSDLGRRCRDTFLSLKKTCRKLGVSFWQFLKDRLTNAGAIPPLPDLLRATAAP